MMGLNMVYGVNDHSGASLWEKYNGKISLKNNLKASFGDFVQAARNKIDNTLSTIRSMFSAIRYRQFRRNVVAI